MVADVVALIEQHVARRSGLKGMALRTGLSMMKAARPDILTRGAERLLPDLAQALEPLHQDFRRGGADRFDAHLERNAGRATALLLEAADRRVARSTHPKVVSNYQRMRGTAEGEVLAAMPAIAALLGRYVK